MHIPQVVYRVYAEHRILFGPGEVIETNRNLCRGDSRLDDVLVRMSEVVQKIRGWFLCRFSEGGIDVNQMLPQIAGVHHVIFPIYLVRLYRQHLLGTGCFLDMESHILRDIRV